MLFILNYFNINLLVFYLPCLGQHFLNLMLIVFVLKNLVLVLILGVLGRVHILGGVSHLRFQGRSASYRHQSLVLIGQNEAILPAVPYFII